MKCINPECGKLITKNGKRCKGCGWKYKFNFPFGRNSIGRAIRN